MTKRPNKRYRVSVQVSKELNDKLELLAQAYSISKSSLCAMFVSQGALQKQKELDFMETNNLNALVSQYAMKGNKENE